VRGQKTLEGSVSGYRTLPLVRVAGFAFLCAV
jgi:hypothetical protein